MRREARCAKPRQTVLEISDEQNDRQDHETPYKDDFVDGITARDILDDQILDGEDENPHAHEGDAKPAAADILHGNGGHE